MSDFYKTRMGQKFYERTMPALVEQLERLNNLIEELFDRLKRQQDREE